MATYNDTGPLTPKREFVCVFPFNADMQSVALVVKSKGPTPDNPKGQIGKCNGWGGKIEAIDASETLSATMETAARRELFEEMGFPNDEIAFHHFCTESYNQGAVVYYFYTKSDELFNRLFTQTHSTDGDIITIRRTDDIVDYKEVYVWNVPYLIQMARAFDSVPKNIWPMKTA